jgi:hypothetical protein
VFPFLGRSHSSLSTLDQLRRDLVERSQGAGVFIAIGGSALTAAVVVFEAHDVVLTEVGAGLNIDEFH